MNRFHHVLPAALGGALAAVLEAIGTNPVVFGEAALGGLVLAPVASLLAATVAVFFARLEGTVAFVGGAALWLAVAGALCAVDGGWVALTPAEPGPWGMGWSVHALAVAALAIAGWVWRGPWARGWRASGVGAAAAAVVVMLLGLVGVLARPAPVELRIVSLSGVSDADVDGPAMPFLRRLGQEHGRIRGALLPQPMAAAGVLVTAFDELAVTPGGGVFVSGSSAVGPAGVGVAGRWDRPRWRADHGWLPGLGTGTPARLFGWVRWLRGRSLDSRQRASFVIREAIRWGPRLRGVHLADGLPPYDPPPPFDTRFVPVGGLDSDLARAEAARLGALAALDAQLEALFTAYEGTSSTWLVLGRRAPELEGPQELTDAGLGMVTIVVHPEFAEREQRWPVPLEVVVRAVEQASAGRGSVAGTPEAAFRSGIPNPQPVLGHLGGWPVGEDADGPPWATARSATARWTTGLGLLRPDLEGVERPVPFDGSRSARQVREAAEAERRRLLALEKPP